MNTHAPSVKKKIRITKHIVRTKEIQEARRGKRKAERKFKKSDLEVDKNNLIVARKHLNKVVEQSRNKFFIDKFSKHRKNIKQTYKIINELLDKNQDNIFPTHSDEIILAKRFAEFYREKVEKIRSSFCTSVPQMFETKP